MAGEGPHSPGKLLRGLPLFGEGAPCPGSGQRRVLSPQVTSGVSQLLWGSVTVIQGTEGDSQPPGFTAWGPSPSGLAVGGGGSILFGGVLLPLQSPSPLGDRVWGHPSPSGVPVGVVVLSPPAPPRVPQPLQVTPGGWAALLKSPWGGPSPSGDSGGPQPVQTHFEGGNPAPLGWGPACPGGPSAPQVTAALLKSLWGRHSPSGDSRGGIPSPQRGPDGSGTLPPPPPSLSPSWRRGGGASPLTAGPSRRPHVRSPRCACARHRPPRPPRFPEPAKSSALPLAGLLPPARPDGRRHGNRPMGQARE